MPTPIISARGIVKKYGDTVVLDHVDLAVEKPGIYSLLGPNGAGKTTLMSIMMGIIRPNEGEVAILGGDPRDPSVRRKIGFCPQEPGLYEYLTGRENAYLFASLYNMGRREARERIERLAEKLGLTRHLDKLVSKYSGGLKKRLSFMVSVLHEPDILLLDEPTTGLDPGSRIAVWDLIREYRDKGKTVLLSTHYMEEADKLSDWVWIIDRGRIIAMGAPEELKQKYGPKSVVRLELQSPPIGGLRAFLEEKLRAVIDEEVVRIYTNDPDSLVPMVTMEVYRLGGRITRLQVTKPTLEDVFIKLTGRRLE